MTSTATVTLLFTDLEGSTELLQRLGDEEARLLWRSHFDLLRNAVAAEGGQEVKNLGDGLMVVFTSARDALACAMGMQQKVYRHNQQHEEGRRLQVRVGLHVGEPIHEEEDYFGTPVVIARRLCECAEGGQILMSEAVRGIIGATEDVEFADRGLFQLKGFPEQWRLYEVLWRREETPAALALATIGERTPFVGRESEQVELRHFLEQAARGKGALVMIGGEPGVGKTRITEELVAEARGRGLLTLTGHCYEMEGAPPYIAFVELLESAARVVEPDALLNALGDSAPEVAKLMPELRYRFPDIPKAPELPPEQERRHVFNGIREYIARAGRIQPLLLVLEDLQWANDSALLLLHHISQQLHEMPVLMVGTYRDVDLDVARSLARTLEDLLRQRLAHRLSLRRLPEADVSAMLRARSGQEPPPRVVKLIYRETEGNPFFVEEVFRHLAEEGKLFDAEGRWRADLSIAELDVPRGIRLLIGRRLERVSEECRRALTAAAVIGRGFSFELLREMVDLEEDALLDAIDEAERTQLISSTTKDREVRFIFAHELIRQTLASSLSLPRRQRLHLRVAEAMERVHARTLEEYAADLAHHFYQAGAAAAPGKTAHYLTLAGDRTLKAAAFEEALRLYEDAISLQPPDDARPRAGLLYKRGLALRSLGRWEEGVTDWWKALADYEGLGDLEAIGRTCAEIATHLIRDARFEVAYETASRGLAALGNRVNAARCFLLATAGFVLSHMQTGGYSAAHDLFTQSLDMAEELEDERLLGPVLGRKAALHHTYWQGREAADVGLRGAELLRSAGNMYDAGYALAYSQCGLIWVGRLDEAARIGAEAESVAARTGNDIARWLTGHYDSLQAVAVTADLEKFEERRAALLEMNRALRSGWTTIDYASLGRAQFWRGRWEEARESFRKGSELDVHGIMTGFSDSLLLLLTAYSRDKEAVLAMLQRSKEILPHAGRPNIYGAWAILEAAVEGLAMLKEWDEAARLYPLALEAIATGNLIRASYAGLVQTTAGIAAAAGGQWEKAEEHYRTALRQAYEIPHTIERPEVRRWYALMLIQRNAPGDRDKAGTLLMEAMAMYRGIGMPRHQEMAEALLDQL